ncbi:MAG: hypothetical protein AVDCRST_MAG73-1096, partial [uncultured Thermomicrobiales bacterium]
VRIGLVSHLAAGDPARRGDRVERGRAGRWRGPRRPLPGPLDSGPRRRGGRRGGRVGEHPRRLRGRCRDRGRGGGLSGVLAPVAGGRVADRHGRDPRAGKSIQAAVRQPPADPGSAARLRSGGRARLSERERDGNHAAVGFPGLGGVPIEHQRPVPTPGDGRRGRAGGDGRLRPRPRWRPLAVGRVRRLSVGRRGPARPDLAGRASVANRSAL